MTDSQIESPLANPSNQCYSPAPVLTDRTQPAATSMTADDLVPDSESICQWDSLGVFTGGDFNLMAATAQFGQDRPKEEDLRGVRQIEPDLHFDSAHC